MQELRLSKPTSQAVGAIQDAQTRSADQEDDRIEVKPR